LNHLQWNRKQLLVAFALYTQVPFGRLHARNPDIIKHAELIGRTPSALAMKLVNIASLDPVITSTGRSGLKSASKADKAMWEEMNSDWEIFWKESQVAVDSVTGIDAKKTNAISDNQASYLADDKMAFASVRHGQDSFRKAVLCAYNVQCCITGIDNPKLLIASHIIPWAKDKKNRLNPCNGLSLSSLHDKAFDSGLLTINEKFEVMLSKELKNGKTAYNNSAFIGFEGCKIIMPEKFTPSQDLLEYHRSHIFTS